MNNCTKYSNLQQCFVSFMTQGPNLFIGVSVFVFLNSVSIHDRGLLAALSHSHLPPILKEEGSGVGLGILRDLTDLMTSTFGL